MRYYSAQSSQSRIAGGAVDHKNGIAGKLIMRWPPFDHIFWINYMNNNYKYMKCIGKNEVRREVSEC